MTTKFIFKVEEFKGMFTQFENVADVTILSFADQGLSVYGNIFKYDPDNNIYTLKYAMFYYICHMLTLQEWAKNGQNGRLTSASQGSVSTSFDLIKSNKPSVDFWLQTPCGNIFYQQYLKKLVVGGRLYTSKHYHPWG